MERPPCLVERRSVRPACLVRGARTKQRASRARLDADP
jgi:hypothetical protein